MTPVEFAIVGAGPAGMAAAILAAELGIQTTLIDEQGSPGGQIYRGIEYSRPGTPLDGRHSAGAELAAAFRAARVDYRPRTTLWHLDPEGVLYLAAGGRTERVRARRVLLATGAIERPVPIPGWTLPGVMTVGAAQILLKTADVVPSGRVVLAGQGPLLYLVAGQLLRAGVRPAMILATTPLANYRQALRTVPRLRLLFNGMRILGEIKRGGVPIRHGVRGLRAIGGERLERVAWERGEIAADCLLLHEGLIPNLQISLALQLRHEWDEEQICWRPALDVWGQTSLPCIAIAGDGGGIAGAAAARLSGELAALDAAMLLGHISEAERDGRAAPIRAVRQRERVLHAMLGRLFRPPHWVLAPNDDETIVCRCEEVTVRQIRSAVRLGVTGLNQLKAFTRCGMGPCQGRICASVAAAVIADALAKPIREIAGWRPRAPFKPITVGALAELELTDPGTGNG